MSVAAPQLSHTALSRTAARHLALTKLTRCKVCLLLALVLLACTPQSTAPTIVIEPVRALRIEAPSLLRAGTPLTILVYVTPATATNTVLLTAQGTFGFLPQGQQPVAGVARFSLKQLHTRFAGAVQVRASSGAIAVDTTVVITPGPAVDPILPQIGPRAIVAGGEQWTMVVATPRDALDNPVVSETPVTFRAQHPVAPTAAPATGVETIVVPTQHLIAWTRIHSRNDAGPLRIAVNAGFGHSPERVVIVTPGLPVPFQLLADKTHAPADGRQLVQISSSQIRDRFGNVLPDGTSTLLLATMTAQDQRALPAITIDGRIYTTIQAPSQPGVMQIQGWIAGVTSEPLTITFGAGPAVQPIEVVTKKIAEGMQVIAGPLVGDLGQFIPDGADVTFTITAPDGQVEEVIAPADYGYAQLLLRRGALVDGEYQITVTAGTGQGAIAFPVTVAAWSP